MEEKQEQQQDIIPDEMEQASLGITGEKLDQSPRKLTANKPSFFRSVKVFLRVARIAMMLFLTVVVVYILMFIETRQLPAGFQAMAPNITSEARLVVRKNPSADAIRRFDVVFYSPVGHEEGTDQTLRLIGRIVGMPGESISSYRGIIYINEEPLEEQYPHQFDISESIPEYEIPENAFFILVDNRSEYKGIDSREFGYVPAGNIISKLLVKF